MFRLKPWIALVLVALTVLPMTASAQVGSEPSDSPVAGQVATSESWVGAAAAIGCGAFTRIAIWSGGTAVGFIAAAIGSCALMLMDGLFS